MKQPTQNESQLSAEMEKRFNDFINQGTSYKEIKHFLATALEEQKAAERTKTIESVLELLREYSKPDEYGLYENMIDVDDLMPQLEAMKGQQ